MSDCGGLYTQNDSNLMLLATEIPNDCWYMNTQTSLSAVTKKLNEHQLFHNIILAMMFLLNGVKLVY